MTLKPREAKDDFVHWCGDDEEGKAVLCMDPTVKVSGAVTQQTSLKLVPLPTTIGTEHLRGCRSAAGNCVDPISMGSVSGWPKEGGEWRGGHRSSRLRLLK